MVVQNQQELGEGSAIPTDPHHTPMFIQLSTQPQKTQKPRKPKRKDTQVPQPSDPTENVTDEAVHKELGDSLVRVATTASSLEAECQETMGDTIAQTRFENVSKQSNDSLIARGNTLRSDEDSLKLNELMELCTTLQKKVLDLEKTKNTQANEIDSLKRKVKNLEKKDRSRTHKLKRLYKGRINAINADEDITLVNVQDDADNEMFDVNALNGEEVFVAGQNENVVEEVVDVVQVSTAATTVTITTEEITLAQALADLKSTKPKAKGIAFESQPTKKKDQIMLDEEIALKLQAEIDEEERIARVEEEKIDESNIAWDDIQAKVNADYQLAERLQAEEQEEELKQESTKKQKVDEDKDTTELQNLMEVIPDEEEVAIDAVPLATKPPTIGRIVRIKSFLMLFGVTAALIDVNAAQSKVIVIIIVVVSSSSGVYLLLVFLAGLWCSRVGGVVILCGSSRGGIGFLGLDGGLRKDKKSF
ncbi:hypothetical protein Tco_0872993 [Tanacetum coccineum]